MKRHLVRMLTAVLVGMILALVGAAEWPPLTTVPNSPRLTGKFVWADLVTDDVTTARKFYTRMFGWTFRDLGNYSIARMRNVRSSPGG